MLTGEADGGSSAGEITLFDSTGFAIQDLAVVKAAFAKAPEFDLQAISL